MTVPGRHIAQACCFGQRSPRKTEMPPKKKPGPPKGSQKGKAKGTGNRRTLMETPDKPSYAAKLPLKVAKAAAVSTSTSAAGRDSDEMSDDRRPEAKKTTRGTAKRSLDEKEGTSEGVRTITTKKARKALERE